MAEKCLLFTCLQQNIEFGVCAFHNLNFAFVKFMTFGHAKQIRAFDGYFVACIFAVGRINHNRTIDKFERNASGYGCQGNFIEGCAMNCACFAAQFGSALRGIVNHIIFVECNIARAPIILAKFAQSNDFCIKSVANDQ